MPLPRPVFALLLVLPLVTAACDGGGAALSEERFELALAERRWAAEAPDDYRFTYRKGCFCALEDVGPFEVTVRGGAVDTVVFVGEVPAEAPGAFEPRPTVEGVEDLFDLVRRAVDDGVDALEVEYDEALGVPLVISIDHDRAAVDDEVGYTVTAFERL